MNFIRRWLLRRKCYIIADGRDNSVTLSKRLFEAMGGYDMKCDKVIVFKVGQRYAFTNQHGIPEEKDTALFPIQRNEKYKCIGFECAVPGLNQIFYNYGLPANVRLKMSIDVKRVKIYEEGKQMEYYEIVPPTARIKKNLEKVLKNDKGN